MKTWRRRSLVDPATRDFVREARSRPDFSLFDLLHGYVYARWLYLYIGVGTGEHWLARTLRPIVNLAGRFVVRGAVEGEAGIHFANTYHGKVVPLEAATQLVTVDEDVSLGDLEHIIPYTICLLYTSPSPRDRTRSRMPSSA